MNLEDLKNPNITSIVTEHSLIQPKPAFNMQEFEEQITARI